MSQQDVPHKRVPGGQRPRRCKRRLESRPSNTMTAAIIQQWSGIAENLLKVIEAQSEQIRHLKLQVELSAVLTSLAASQPKPFGK